MKITKVEEILPVTLTADEMSALATELGRLETEIEAVRQAKKESAKEFGENIERLQRLILRKAKIATDGQEERSVPCEWMIYRDEGIRRLIRWDTFREVRNEALTEEEKQAGLFDEPLPPVQSKKMVALADAAGRFLAGEDVAVEIHTGDAAGEVHDATFINEKAAGKKRGRPRKQPDQPAVN